MTKLDWKSELPQKSFVRTLHHNDGEELMEYINHLISQAKAEGYQAAIEDMNEDKAYKENKL